MPCSQCLVKVKMMQPNKIMQYLLMNTIRFNCDKCQRHWLFPEYRVHKMRGHCVPDPHAENSIQKLKGKTFILFKTSIFEQLEELKMPEEPQFSRKEVWLLQQTLLSSSRQVQPRQAISIFLRETRNSYTNTIWKQKQFTKGQSTFHSHSSTTLCIYRLQVTSCS